MGRSLQDALAKASIVRSTLPSRPVPQQGVSSYVEPVQRQRIDESCAAQTPWTGAPETAQWCSVMTGVMGAQRLIALLNEGIDGGTGNDRRYVEDALESAIESLPKRKADDVRARAGRGPWRGKGVPTWMADAREALECLQGGGHVAWAREQDALDRAASAIAIPAPLDGEDADAYDARLQEWEGDQVVAHLKRISYDRYELVKALRERLHAAAEAAKEKRIAEAAAPILALFRTAATWREAIDRVTAAYDAIRASDYDMSHFITKQVLTAAQESRWPWTMRARLVLGGWARPEAPADTTPITADDASGLTDQYLLAAVEPTRPALVTEARKRWPHKPGEVYVMLTGGGFDGSGLGVVRDGLRQEIASYDTQAPPKTGAYPTEPCAAGWWGSKGYCGPDVWQALQALRTVQRGSVYLGEVYTRYGRHPQKGYGRLSWSVKAGGGHDGFELPVDEAIARRLDAICRVAHAGVKVPPDALWVNAALGATTAGRPKLIASAGAAKRAVLSSVGATAIGRGRHGWEGSTAGASARGSSGASLVLRSLHASSRGGGLVSAVSVLWLVEGEAPLPTADGSGLIFSEAGAVRVAIPVEPE